MYLPLKLRKANRTIQRLREVGLAARDENAVSLRAALAALHARDLERREPISRAESRPNASLSAASEHGSLRARGGRDVTAEDSPIPRRGMVGRRVPARAQ